MKKKLNDFIASKGGKWAIFGTLSFLLFGIACFVVGYGIVDGWDAVIKWFSSKWAIMLYVFIGLWAVVIAWVVYIGKTRGDK